MRFELDHDYLDFTAERLKFLGGDKENNHYFRERNGQVRTYSESGLVEIVGKCL